MRVTEKRDDEYLDFIRGKPCLFCGSPGIPHHFGLGNQGKGMGTKCDDTYTIPLCQVHHEWIHNGKIKVSKEKLFDIFLKYRDRLMKLFNERKEMRYGGENCTTL